MTLRHIDPRSSDWMDAMLEGEPAKKPVKEVAKEGAVAPESGEFAADLQAAGPPGPRGADREP